VGEWVGARVMVVCESAVKEVFIFSAASAACIHYDVYIYAVVDVFFLHADF